MLTYPRAHSFMAYQSPCGLKDDQRVDFQMIKEKIIYGLNHMMQDVCSQLVLYFDDEYAVLLIKYTVN